MLKTHLTELLSLNYENHLLLIDYEKINRKINYKTWLLEAGFEIFLYEDKLDFRVIFEDYIKYKQGKIAVIVDDDIFIPYDIRQTFYQVEINWLDIYPRLDSECLKRNAYISYELLYIASQDYTGPKLNLDQSTEFISKISKEKNYVLRLISVLDDQIKSILNKGQTNYRHWFKIAQLYSEIQHLSAVNDLNYDNTVMNNAFMKYIQLEFGKLPTVLDRDGPIINTQVIDFILKDSNKVAFLVMDGMSIQDYYVIRDGLCDLEIEENFIFSMIPTTTSISRQSLISGKFPIEISNLFSLKDEKKLFKQAATRNNYKENQIEFSNDIDFEANENTHLLLMILNNIDNMIHSQTQGKKGLVSDLEIFSESGALRLLIKRLLYQGFEVYMSSDHGNTQAYGLGKLIGTGVEVETRSSRMLILKNIVSESGIVSKYELTKYPGYFLDKNFNYYLSKYGESMDIKGSTMLCHGGSSIEEVIVPFVRIKERRNG